MDRRTVLAQPPSTDLPLGIPGFRWADLHDAQRLAELTRAFDAALRGADAALFARYEGHRSGAARLRGPEESALLLEVGAHLSRFVARLFGVEDELSRVRAAAGRDAPIFRVKREFVQRRVFRKGAKDRPHATGFAALDAQAQPLLAAAARRHPRVSSAGDDVELRVALLIETLLDAAGWTDLSEALQRGLADAALPAQELSVAALLDLFDRWMYALSLQPGRPDWMLLRLPHALDFQQLVPLRRPDAARPEVLRGHEEHQRRRDGFRLTDPRMTAREVRSEIDYCIYCHEREKDSCARGFPEKDSAHFRRNTLGSRSPAARWKSESRKCTPPRVRVTSCRRWPWSASTTRWRRARATGSATTA